MGSEDNLLTVTKNATSVDRIRLRKVLVYGSCVIVGLILLVVVALLLRNAYLHAFVYIDHQNEIHCIDVVTGVPVEVEIKILKDGGLDDDPDKRWSIGPEPGGKITCTRNVWIMIEITAPGYQRQQVKLDDSSPNLIVLKMEKTTGQETRPNSTSLHTESRSLR